MLPKHFLVLVIFFILISCSKKEPVYTPATKVDPHVLYKEAYSDFENNDFFNASKKFAKAEINFENLEFAAKASIMNCFSLYGINFYDESLEGLNRFLKNYPADKNVIYAEYLKAIIFFEQISDEKKDLQPLLEAKKQIDYFIKKYPETDYSIDLKFKNDLILNQLAAKEIFVAKYYISVQKWIPAINRLKLVVQNYDETVFIEEALHRLVEIYFHLGLEKEANKYANILGYNYNSSEWYEASYKILNKDYNVNKITKKKTEKQKDGLVDRIIKMIK